MFESLYPDRREQATKIRSPVFVGTIPKVHLHVDLAESVLHLFLKADKIAPGEEDVKEYDRQKGDYHQNCGDMMLTG